MPLLWGRFDRREKARSWDDRSRCTCSGYVFERDDDAEYEINSKLRLVVNVRYVPLFLQPDILKFLMAYTGNNEMKLIFYKQFKFFNTFRFDIVI
jgi:hypothetical protein